MQSEFPERSTQWKARWAAEKQGSRQPEGVWVGNRKPGKVGKAKQISVVFRKSASKEEWKSYYSAGNAGSSRAFYGLLAIQAFWELRRWGGSAEMRYKMKSPES